MNKKVKHKQLPAEFRKKGTVSVWEKWLKYMPLMIFLFAFLLYANTLKHLYAIDDNIAIYSNKLVLAGFDNLSELLTKPFYYGSAGEGGDNQIYRPLTSLSFATDIALFGENPFGFHHFMNVLLYALSAVFLYLLLKRLLRNQHKFIPLIITLLYISHPIHTEVVANIKSRDEILSLLFGLLLTLYCLFKYLDTQNFKYLIFSILAYFLGIFSKENSITFLVIIPLSLYFFTNKPNRKIILLSLPYIAVAGIYLVVREICIGGMPKAEPDITQNVLLGAHLWSERCATAMFIMLNYFKLLIFPHPLVWDYSFNQIPLIGFGNFQVILSILFHLFLLGFALWNFRKKNLFSYCILFYFITISISSNLFIMTGSTMGERFQFIPSFAFCFALTLILFTLFKIRINNKLSNNFIIIIAGILVAYSIKSYTRNKDWKDSLTVSLSAIKYSPNSIRVQSTLGAVYLKMAKIEEYPKTKDALYREIIKICNKIIKIYPIHEESWYNLGISYYKLNDYERAEVAFKKQLELKPKDVKAYNNLAGLYYFRKDFKTAIKYFKRFVDHNPNDIEAVNNLGVVYMDNIKDQERALTYFLRALEIDSNYAHPYERIGIIYQTKQRFENAIVYFRKAYELDPSKTYLLKNIGDSYFKLGKIGEAIQYYNKIKKNN